MQKTERIAEISIENNQRIAIFFIGFFVSYSVALSFLVFFFFFGILNKNIQQIVLLKRKAIHLLFSAVQHE